jgi:hypothetical protein
MNRRLRCCLVAAALTALCARGADAASVFYDVDNNGGAAGFAAAVAGPLTEINFDDLPANTNIGGMTISDVTFNSPPGGAPLLVVDGNATFTPDGFTGAADAATNKLLPTSGANVLSPGGTELAPGFNEALENDDIELVFPRGVAAFGFDHLSQSADGLSFTVIEAFNHVNELLFSEVVAISDVAGFGGPGGADFWGVIAGAGEAIRRIVINEQDENEEFPDCNIGLDSIRFQFVPEPAGLSLAAAVAGFGVVRRRRCGAAGHARERAA